MRNRIIPLRSFRSSFIIFTYTAVITHSSRHRPPKVSLHSLPYVSRPRLSLVGISFLDAACVHFVASLGHCV